MKLVNALAFALFVSSAQAFGPAQPLNTGVSNSGTMQMNIGQQDLYRRQKFNVMIKDAAVDRTKESVESILLSDETSAMIKKCQWKLRKYMIRKVRQQAYAVGAEVDPKFGVIPTMEERTAAEIAASAVLTQERAAAVAQAAEDAAKSKAENLAKAAARKERQEANKRPSVSKAPPAAVEKPAAPAAAAAVEAPAAAPAAEAPAAPAAAAAGGEITPKTIKQLRDATGAGMMDCKRALIEAEGDQEAAAESLRKNGLSKADKKAARVAAEGRIAVANKDGKSVLVEVNCETDFVGKDSTFLKFCENVANAAVDVEGDDLDSLLAKPVEGGSVEQIRQALVSKIGENIQVRRLVSRGGSGSTVGAYVHMNRIGVMVEIEGGTEQLCSDIAMHVAAMNPPFATPDQVPQDVLDNERRILSEQALESGKPAAIVEKMVEGRIRKYLEEICLVSQNYVRDSDKTVAKLLEENGAKMIGFTRIAVGEGIEKKEDDFAAEVAKMAGGN